MTTPDTRAPAGSSIELAIGGMTCASCANRIEKKLNKLDGVTATVNYATEKARVQYDGERDPADLVAAVESAGYTATLPQPKKPVSSSGDRRGHRAGAGAGRPDR
jgi:Cu+-exporting ATPase